MDERHEISYYDENTMLHRIRELDSSESVKFYAEFVENFHRINDPRIYLPFVTNHFKIFNSPHISQSLFLIMSNYDVEFDNFHSGLFEILTDENIENYGVDFLSFLKAVLIEGKISLKVIKAFIKKLARVALDVSSQRAYEILNFIFSIMKYYPVCFDMVHGASCTGKGTEITMGCFEPYLYEFDILEAGILPTKNLVQRIRKYRYGEKNRIDPRTYLEEGYGKTIDKYL